MKTSLEKSKFFKLETALLGYIVSHTVIKTDPEKIAAITKYPIPRNIRELRSFLDLTGYYNKFVRLQKFQYSLTNQLYKLLHAKR